MTGRKPTNLQLHGTFISRFNSLNNLKLHWFFFFLFKQGTQSPLTSKTELQIGIEIITFSELSLQTLQTQQFLPPETMRSSTVILALPAVCFSRFKHFAIEVVHYMLKGLLQSNPIQAQPFSKVVVLTFQTTAFVQTLKSVHIFRFIQMAFSCN